MGFVLGLVCTTLVARPSDCHHAGAVKKPRPCAHTDSLLGCCLHVHKEMSKSQV